MLSLKFFSYFHYMILGKSQIIGGGKLLNDSLNLLSFLISYSNPVLKNHDLAR